MPILSKWLHTHINSATQYPKIPTFQKLGEKGVLTNEHNTVFPTDQTVIVTEKVDGTNARVIVDASGDLFIGSREHLLYARGDRIPNPAENIVHTLRPLTWGLPRPDDGLAVYYLEVYGSHIGSAWKQYTGHPGEFGARLFDVAYIPIEALDGPVERIAAWRKNGGQQFANEAQLAQLSHASGLPLTPRLDIIPGSCLPTTVAETHPYLCAIAGETRVALDEDAHGNAEGIVIRTPDRSHIAKVRFKDYERTARKVAEARAKAA
ncbi:RNA ligase family protein [Nocardiopsis sp. CT-R113]|uniref:RNA ligase family protein n=1 Tax=Nocardiopsis codii TaxID=3065942 RepID=A0ABU7KCY2_9ACTN|nr:RNA ligase family protein [Nocardiopsis sp. CT-R113]MEE2040090.1 RNA ligase family protein [Nocardiopsis sp. CT-R113]